MEPHKQWRELLEEAKVFWRTLVIVLTPLILLPFVFAYPYPEVACAYIVLIMSVFWISEALPMGVTGLLPVILFPIMGLMPMSVIAGCYMRNVQLLLMGSLMLAVAVERCNLHRRVALTVLLRVGTSPRRLLLGIMLATGLLSMFVANIPTTAMMIPVVEAIIEELNKQPEHTDASALDSDRHSHEESSMLANGTLNVEDQVDRVAVSKYTIPSVAACYDLAEKDAESSVHEQLNVKSGRENTSKRKNDPVAKMLSIAVCYAANIGGCGTLTGSGTNIVAFEMWEDHYQKRGKESPVSYATWIPAALPGSVIMIIITWLWIQVYFLRGNCWRGPRSNSKAEATRRMIQRQYDQLGPVSFAEKSNLTVFILLTLLWFFRAPGFMPGYGQLFANDYVTDAVPAVLIGVLLFILPYECPKMLWWKKPGEKPRRVSGLLEWSTTYPNLAWTAFFIVGGGFSIAEGCDRSGLSAWLGANLESLAGLDHWLVVLITCLLVGALSQVTSNLAAVSLTIPILLTLSDSIDANPLHLTLPATLVCSSAFMLPAASVPNAMVFEAGHLTTIDMVMCGFVTNLFFVLVTVLGAETWMMALYDFGTLPWDPAGNANITTMPTTPV